VGTHGMSGDQIVSNRRRGSGTFRMRKSISSRVDNVIGTIRSAGSNAGRYVVEIQRKSRFPRNIVIGTGTVATDTNGSDQLAVLVVKSKAASEHINAADFFAAHRIVVLAVVGRIPFVCNRSVDRIALLKTEKCSTRLDGGEEVGSGQCQSRQAERI